MRNFFSPLKLADKFTLVFVALLGIMSLLMLESTVYSDGFVMDRAVWVQAVAYILGFIVMVVVLHLEYTMFIGLNKYLYIASVVLLLSVYVPGLGIEQYGSRAWINLGVTTLQPSEFVKILFILIMANYLSDHREDIKKFRGVLLSGLYALPIIAIVLKEDLGSALVYMVIWLFMVFFAGIDYKILFKSIIAAVAALPVVYSLLGDYQKQRIEAFLHPDNLNLPGNYQVWQSKVAIGSGGFWGKGLFNGTQKELDFIPVQQSDFIFSVVVEELGFVGGLFVILLYAGLLFRFIKIIRDALDLYGALIVVGFTAMFLFQIFENIAMTMGLMPVTGITLPLLSGGGTSVVASLISIGVILNIGINSKPIRF
ncbi:MAG: FtsW/RodA/SpoVE family cell cycle protein [Anaerovoracaceae bacterium]|nr:rod shape-determining protein RodA [Bacillota bacterium]MEE0517768.1 FtsW/RodA/SpoVE family cell cycle protein [Anaerovoracaceae bacterium]